MRWRAICFLVVLVTGLLLNPWAARAEDKDKAEASDVSVEASSLSFDYSPFARVLDNYVTERGFVQYARLQADRGDLDAFVEQLAQVSPENSPEIFPERQDQLAYWINAYNAIVMKGILDHYPVESLSEISFMYGFFWKLKFPVGGREYTLNDIEHGILRPRFQEPRIHFAINCASDACPKLTREPFLPEKLDEQLDQAARFFIGESRNVRPEPESNRLYLSMIFNWFLDDFRNYARENLGKQYPSVLDYILLHASPELKHYIESSKPKIRYIPYDWSLNDAGK